MRSRLGNLTKWQYLGEGDALHYSLPKPRTVVLEANSPGEVCYYVLQGTEQVDRDPERLVDRDAGRLRKNDTMLVEGDTHERGGYLQFVGVHKGRCTLEFAVSGAFDLVAEGGGTYVFSNDGQQMETHVVEPYVYTRIANRRQRNPHMELIQYQMQLNQQRFMQQLEEETERRISAIERRAASYAPQRDQRAAPAIAELKARAERAGMGGDAGAGDDIESRADDDPGGAGGSVPEGGTQPKAAAKSRRKADEAAGS